MPKVGQRSALRSRLLRVFAGFDACDLPESAPAIGSQTFMRLPCATGLGGHYPAHRLAIGRRRNERPEVVRAHGVTYVGVQLARPSVIGGAASTSYPTTRLHHQGIPERCGPMLQSAAGSGRHIWALSGFCDARRTGLTLLLHLAGDVTVATVIWWPCHHGADPRRSIGLAGQGKRMKVCDPMAGALSGRSQVRK